MLLPALGHGRAQSYLQTAVRLSNPDAQQELAFCLANGKGCKKDRKEAAKWYRVVVVRCELPLLFRLGSLSYMS